MVGTAASRLLAENGYIVSRLLRRQSAAKIVEAPPVEKPTVSHTAEEVPNEIQSDAQDEVENEVENEIQNEVQSESQAEPLTGHSGRNAPRI